MSSDAIDILVEHVSASGQRAVSAAVSLAASAGIATFARGGNAFDAALAACFVETIALPMKCGLAGDLVALFRQRGGPLRALISVGGAPAAVDQGQRLETVGPASVGVPGAPAGYAALMKMGRLDGPVLAQPAIRAARQGVPWTRVGLGYLKEARPLLEHWSPACVYLQSSTPAVGDVLQLPGLARLLEDFCREGAGLFHGEHGEALVRAVQARGGFLDLGDLQSHRARECDPVALPLGHATLYATPEPTQGPALLEVMRRLHGHSHDLQRRASRHASPCWNDADLAQRVSEVRAEAHAAQRSAHDGGTSVVTAADEEGNAVVIVHSNSFPRFGSGIVLDNGLVLNNRPGRGFALDAPSGAPGAPKGGRVPPTTLHAWALLGGDADLLGATPGGINQLAWNSQTVASLLAGAPAQRVVVEPRWSLTPQGGYSAESGVVLSGHGLEASARPQLANGSVQQILRVRSDGRISVYADPRAGGTALALT